MEFVAVRIVANGTKPAARNVDSPVAKGAKQTLPGPAKIDLINPEQTLGKARTSGFGVRPPAKLSRYTRSSGGLGLAWLRTQPPQRSSHVLERYRQDDP